MSGGGKSSTSTSSVSIPPEVLARYNAVNARAEEVAQQPFTPYSGQFVAPLTGTQQAGITNVSQAAGAAQPYYQAAGTALLGGAAQAQPYYQAATQSLYGGQAAAAPFHLWAPDAYQGAPATSAALIASASKQREYARDKTSCVAGLVLTKLTTSLCRLTPEQGVATNWSRKPEIFSQGSPFIGGAEQAALLQLGQGHLADGGAGGRAGARHRSKDGAAHHIGVQQPPRQGLHPGRQAAEHVLAQPGAKQDLAHPHEQGQRGERPA